MGARTVKTIATRRGEGVRRTLRFKGRLTNAAVPLTAAEFGGGIYPLSDRKPQRDGGVVLAVTSGADARLTVTDAAAGEATLSIAAADLAVLTAGDWWWEALYRFDPADDFQFLGAWIWTVLPSGGGGW